MMKKIYIILTIFAVLTLQACDYLKEKPKSTYTKSNAITDEAGLRAAVVGCYQGLINLYVINTNTPIFLSLLGTDELCYRANNTNVRSIVDRYSYTPAEGCIGELWLRYYTIISRTNVVIEAARNLDQIPEEVRVSCEGEARFMRAWSYFQLVQFFGDLPLMDSEIKEFDYTVGRSPLKDVYRLITDDLIYASADGVLSREIKDGHASQIAARTLLGKVYLTMASSKEADVIKGYQLIEESSQDLYRKAYDILDDLIENSGRDLLPVYNDVFKIENKNVNKESIWEIQFSAQEPYGTQWAKELGMTNTGYSQTAGGWRYCAIGGQCNLNSLPSFRGYYKSFSQDVRKNWNVCDSLIRYDAKSGKPTKVEHILGLSGIKPSFSAPVKPVPPAQDDPDYDSKLEEYNQQLKVYSQELEEYNAKVFTVLTDNRNKTLVQRSSATKYRWGTNVFNDYPISYLYTNCPNNIIALRFADVLLMFTEADMALNGGVATDKGLERINRVVKRARGLDKDGNPVPAAETPDLPDYTASTLTFDELMKERARELCFEFWRRHDLVRTGMLESVLALREVSTDIKTSFDPEKHYLLPVPQYEIDNSLNKEGMYQNPNY